MPAKPIFRIVLNVLVGATMIPINIPGIPIGIYFGALLGAHVLVIALLTLPFGIACTQSMAAEDA